MWNVFSGKINEQIQMIIRRTSVKYRIYNFVAKELEVLFDFHYREFFPVFICSLKVINLPYRYVGYYHFDVRVHHFGISTLFCLLSLSKSCRSDPGHFRLKGWYRQENRLFEKGFLITKKQLWSGRGTSVDEWNRIASVQKPMICIWRDLKGLLP